MTEQEIASYKEQMFGHSSTQSPTPNDVPPADTPPVDTPPSDLSPTDTPPVDTPPADTPPTEVVDADEYAKSVGYDNWEALKADVPQLKTFKETAPKPIEYANEESKKVHELLLAGKVKEVKAIYDAQEKLDEVLSLEVTETTAESILKTGMQFKYKDLTPQQIEYKYNKQYGIPKEPNEDKFLTKEEYEDAKEEWEEKVNEIKMDRIIDAKLLKPELEKSKQEIKLPDIPSTPNPELEEFEAFKQSQTASDETHKILVQTVSKLSEKDVSYNLNFNDEAKKVKVDISYLGDKEGVDKAKAAAADYATFLQTTYYNEDGSPLGDKLTKDIYLLQNKEKVFTEMVKQAVNETMLQIARNQKNIGDGFQRNFNVVEPDAVQKLKEQVFGKTG